MGWAAAIPAAIAATSSLIGGHMRNEAQIASAKDQMKFQERMSSTAYQRAMSDMRKAGLNPILAGKLGGASSPGGAMPQLQDILTPAVSSAMDVERTQADVDLKEEQTELTEKQQDIADQTAENLEKDGLHKDYENIKNAILTKYYQDNEFALYAKDAGLTPQALVDAVAKIFGFKIPGRKKK